jgi:hypothetical protein
MSRLDRVSNTKAANIIIVVGLVLFGTSVLYGLLNTFSNQYTFSPTGGDPSLKDRLQIFLNSSLNYLPWSALVVAAGFALRTYAQRTPPVAPSPESLAPPVPFEDMPVQLPITIDVVSGPVDDDVWRR